jgi:predicted 3-demethylubiquinone-9 3-methyltransferase (glyoxalase superfamily)
MGRKIEKPNFGEIMARQKVTPFLWFDHEAEEAANFYVSLFPDSAITSVTPGPGGKALVVEFKLAGIHYLALNGCPYYKLTEAFSLSIDCQTQSEVDMYWDKLTEGGSTSRCGWLKDKFGLSWQVVPTILPELLGDADHEKAGRVMNAMMGMIKLDIQVLKQAGEKP